MFDSVSTRTDGLSLAIGNGIPAKLRGDWGAYGILNQQVWRLSEKDADKGANVFLRIMGSPSDRNEIDFHVDTGITFMGIIPGRSNDVIGLAFAYNRISPDLSALQKQEVALGQRSVVQDYEAVIELMYQAQIVPGWILQPDFQYFWHPGGHAPISDAPNAPAIPNATVIGLRTVINY